MYTCSVHICKRILDCKFSLVAASTHHTANGLCTHRDRRQQPRGNVPWACVRKYYLINHSTCIAQDDVTARRSSVQARDFSGTEKSKVLTLMR